MNVGPAGASSSPYVPPVHGSTNARPKAAPLSAASLGSGRLPQLRGLNALLAVAYTAKMGFRESSPAELPEKAREALATKAGKRDAVACWVQPGTGETRVVVQNEDRREQFQIYSWRNGAWTTLLDGVT